MKRVIWLAFLASVPSACGPAPDARTSADAHAVEVSGRPREASQEQTSLLAELSRMEAGEPVDRSGVHLSVGPEYLAASGFKCRRAQIDGSRENDGARVVCHDDEGWFFARPVQGRLDGPGP